MSRNSSDCKRVPQVVASGVRSEPFGSENMTVLLFGTNPLGCYLEQEATSPCALYFLDFRSRLALSLSCKGYLGNAGRVRLIMEYLKGYRRYYFCQRDACNSNLTWLWHDLLRELQTEDTISQLEEQYAYNNMTRQEAELEIKEATEKIEVLLGRNPLVITTGLASGRVHANPTETELSRYLLLLPPHIRACQDMERVVAEGFNAAAKLQRFMPGLRAMSQ